MNHPNYSEALESLNSSLIGYCESLFSHTMPREVLNYAYVQLLEEAKSISQLAKSIRNLSDTRNYLESLTLVRKLLERTLHFKAANNFPLTINYLQAPDETSALRCIASRGEEFSIHLCETTKNKSVATCIQYQMTPSTAVRYPMARYVQMGGRDALGHNFPKNYRQFLWGFIDEDEVRADNLWMSNHYTRFAGILRNLKEIHILSESDKAKLETHYGFLSAIAHSPSGLVDELHGRNGIVGNFYGPSNRLVSLYIATALILVIESTLPWVSEYEFIQPKKIEEGETLIAHRDILLAELGFPFGDDHAFDTWRQSLPHLAVEVLERGGLNLSRNYLDPDFLARIEMIHTAQTEYSVGKTWVPRNLFGLDT